MIPAAAGRTMGSVSTRARLSAILATTLLWGFIGINLLPVVHAEELGWPVSPAMLAMGQSPDTRDMGAPPGQGLPEYEGRDAPSSSDLSRFAIARKVELKKSLAQAIRNDAYALQQQRRYREAVALYRESLVYWPDPGLETYIRAFEGRAGLATPGLSYGSTAYPANSGRAGSVVATFRNRSPADVLVTAGASASSPGTLVRAGDIVTLSVPLSQGQVPFLVHWNGKLIASGTWYEDPPVRRESLACCSTTPCPGGSSS